MRGWWAVALLAVYGSGYGSRGEEVAVDPKGYVVYCPCMGRFGNQMEQHLGAFQFAHLLKRTLVLPPIVVHPPRETRAKMLPFEDVFQLGPIKAAFKVITMTEFQRDVMPVVWPKDKRIAFCWSPRKAFDKNAKDTDEVSCNAKDGNPFGPFWDHVGVDFVGSEFFGSKTGGYELGNPVDRQKWNERYTTRITSKAKKFIEEKLRKPFVGIHLRNDRDWDRVCDHVDPKRHLFASAQCLGEIISDVPLTKEICEPSRDTILEQLREVVGSTGAKSVFVSSDREHMIDEINEALSAYDVEAFKLDDNDPFVSLAVLELADAFIGNCVSTFSSTVSRSRQYKWSQPRPNHFWGYRKPSARPKIEL